jgi:hypothetical protein
MVQILIIVVLSIALIGMLGGGAATEDFSPNRIRVRRIGTLNEQLALKKPMKV